MLNWIKSWFKRTPKYNKEEIVLFGYSRYFEGCSDKVKDVKIVQHSGRQWVNDTKLFSGAKIILAEAIEPLTTFQHILTWCMDEYYKYNKKKPKIIFFHEEAKYKFTSDEIERKVSKQLKVLKKSNFNIDSYEIWYLKSSEDLENKLLDILK